MEVTDSICWATEMAQLNVWCVHHQPDAISINRPSLKASHIQTNICSLGFSSL
jgi:hypothetical protein